MRLLDLYCKAGGASKGYADAGFDVVGVDIEPQPHYPFRFILDDALEVLRRGAALGVGYDAIHASPPCQAFSNGQIIRGRDHPDLVTPTRALLERIGLPYVIENVRGAPLRNPQVLEGQMFGLNTHRPRLFETNWGYEAPLMRSPPPPQAKMGRPLRPGQAIQVVGNFSDVTAARLAMGIDWMTRDELKEAIPPAYTEAIGRDLLATLRRGTTCGTMPAWNGQPTRKATP